MSIHISEPIFCVCVCVQHVVIYLSIVMQTHVYYTVLLSCTCVFRTRRMCSTYPSPRKCVYIYIYILRVFGGMYWFVCVVFPMKRLFFHDDLGMKRCSF